MATHGSSPKDDMYKPDPYALKLMIAELREHNSLLQENLARLEERVLTLERIVS